MTRIPAIALIMVNWAPRPSSTAASRTFSPAAPLSTSAQVGPHGPIRSTASRRSVSTTSSAGGLASIAGEIWRIARTIRGSSTTRISRYGTFEAVGARLAAATRRSSSSSGTGSGA